jgi:hypothetical protein
MLIIVLAIIKFNELDHGKGNAQHFFVNDKDYFENAIYFNELVICSCACG